MGCQLNRISHLERFSTADVSPAGRLDYWKRIAQETFIGLEVEATVADFGGELMRWRIGDLLLTRARASSSRVAREPVDVRQADRVILHLQSFGVSRQYQGLRTCELAPGDFSMASCAEYFLNTFPGRHEVLAVEAPLPLIEKHAPNFDLAMSRSISGTTPGARMLRDFLLSLWRLEADLKNGSEVERSLSDNMGQSWAQGVQVIYMDLLSLAITGAAESRQEDNSLLARLKQLIESRLHDPTLRTASIADELGVSSRSVQLAFSALHTTPSAYIIERRMLLAAEYLMSSPHMSITDIAMELGFNECSYFTRCFRKHFGMTPMAYRKRC